MDDDDVAKDTLMQLAYCIGNSSIVSVLKQLKKQYLHRKYDGM